MPINVNVKFYAIKCSYHLRRLRAVRQQLGRDVAARLVAVLVLSRLDYCNAVLAGLPTSTLAPLQRVLHAAARTVLNLKPRDHCNSSFAGVASVASYGEDPIQVMLAGAQDNARTHDGLHRGPADACS